MTSWACAASPAVACASSVLRSEPWSAKAFNVASGIVFTVPGRASSLTYFVSG